MLALQTGTTFYADVGLCEANEMCMRQLWGPFLVDNEGNGVEFPYEGSIPVLILLSTSLIEAFADERTGA